VARELYGIMIPVALVDRVLYDRVRNEDVLEVSAQGVAMRGN